jgi:hydrophobic/amphiphilic exporter-1 (mainly G- bacteria), HAE1 family
MVVAAVVVFGYVSFNQMPVDLMPELSYPTVTVRTNYAGAAPEEVEDEVVEPMEDLLRTVEGVVGVSSISRAGSGDVILRFQWDTGLDFATQKVRERIGLLDFPEAVEPPLILRYDPTLDPILRLAVTGDLALADLRYFAEEELQRELEKVEGVAMVRVFGGEEAIIRVSVDERRLEALQLDIAVIRDRLRSENVNVAGGRLYEGDVEYLVRTVNEFEGIEDVGALVIAVRDGGVVRLRDVAEIAPAVRDRTILTRVDGRESIEIAVFKEADANLVGVAEAVKRTIFGRRGGASAPDASDPDAEAALASGSGEGSADAVSPGDEDDERGWASTAPDGLEVVILSDQSAYIRAAIDEVVGTAVLGGLCAVFVLLVFLRRLYATLVIGLAIPLSVMATFAPMQWLGVSLNVMSLGGLALGIGMLVDNAIVVLESIVRCREEGDDLREAALRGTQEVGGAVVASTLTTVAVFFPIVFVEGIAGQLFGDLAIAVVLSLLASLAFALFFVPMMLVLPGRGGAEPGETPFHPLQSLASVDAARGDLAVARGRWHGGGVGRVVASLSFGWILVRTPIWFAIDTAVRVVATVAWVVVSGLRRIWGVVSGAGAALNARFRRRPSGEGTAVERWYAWTIARCLRAGAVVLVLAGLSLFWTTQTYGTLGLQLIPELQQGEFTAEVRLPVGSQLEETAAMLALVEAALVTDERVSRVATFIGRNEDDLEASDQGEHYAELTVVVADAGEHPGRESEVMESVRRLLEQQPAVRYELVRPTLFSLEAPIAVEVRGDSLDALSATARQIEELASGVEGLDDVRSNMQPGFPEVRVRFNRERLAALGLDVRAVAEVVRDKVQGGVPTELRPDERSIDVELRVDRANMETIADLGDLVVGFVSTDAGGDANALLLGGGIGASGAGERRAVRLSAVAEIELSRGPAEIRHLDGQRAAVVTASSSVLDIEAAVAELQGVLDRGVSPGEQVVRIAGQSDEMAAAQRSLGFALLLAVFLVYVVMASNFESLLAPLVILFSIPLALVGVVAMLVGTGTPLSVVVFIGGIVLAGIVVNNAIVLVDTVLLYRRRGIAKREAIVEAGRVRLRPVMITAMTTVLGLLPMALGLGEGAEIRRPLAWVVIAGLASSTVLTLVIIPVLYDWLGELFGAPSMADDVDTALADARRGEPASDA